MEKEYRAKLLGFYKSKRRMPSYAEAAKLFGFASKNAAHRLIQKFIDAGLVERTTGGRLAPGSGFGEVRVLGSVKAGFPTPADEDLTDTMSLDDFLIERKEATYLLKVDGDSMIGAHIAPGDLVLVERTTQAKDGEIVVAEVDGEWTMKYFRSRGGRVWLEAANPKYPPIKPEGALSIAGRVCAVIRKFK